MSRLAAIVASVALAASSLLTAASPLDRTKPDVIVAEGAAHRSTYFPTVARLRGGELVVVYYDSPDHVSQAGHISVVRSIDDGHTWSAPRPIVDTPFDDRDPSIVQIGTGALLVSFFVRDWSVSPGRSVGVFVARSDDFGLTWQTPVKVDTRLGRPTTPGGPSTSAKIVELENGTLLLPIYGAPPDTDDQRSSVVGSTDGGRTWPRANEIDIGYASGVNLVEPAVVGVGGNYLLAKMRSERSDNLGYEARSFDGGLTWSRATKTAFAAQASDLVPLFITGRSTALVIHAWGDFSSQFGIGRPTVIGIEDPNATWRFGRPQVVYHGGCSWGDESYPSSVLLGDGRLFTVYYDACRGYIGGTYVSLLELARLSAPSAPANLTALVSGNTVTLGWEATIEGSIPTSYVVEAGSSSGASDLARFDTATAATSFTAASVPARTYFVRVRARNPAGTSNPSSEVTLAASQFSQR